MITALFIVVVLALLFTRTPRIQVEHVTRYVAAKPAHRPCRTPEARTARLVRRRPRMHPQLDTLQWICPCGQTESMQLRASGGEHACSLETWS